MTDTKMEIASWQTSKGEVIPVYEDFNGCGIDYKLTGFWIVQTEQGIKVSEIKDDITPENRICTLEQAEVYMKAVESFMEDMKTTENTRDKEITVLCIGHAMKNMRVANKRIILLQTV